MASVQPSAACDSAAMRRRQRRLRSWLRHERMTVAMALAESTHHSSRGQKNERAGEHELNYTATIREPPLPPPPPHTPAGALQPRRRAGPDAAGQDCPGRRSGFCGAPCSRLSMLSLRCRLSTILRRRWWNRCRTSCISSTRSRLIPCSMMSQCEPLFALRSWRNSWEKCHRSCLSFNLSNNLSSRSLTVQFLGRELVEVFKVFSQDRATLSAEQIVDNPVSRLDGGGSLQGLHRGQSSTAFFGAYRRVPRSRWAASSSVSPGHAGQGFFRTFRGIKKSPKVAREVDEKLLRTSAHPRRRLMAVTTPGSGSCPPMRSSTIGDDFLVDAGWLVALLAHAR